MDTATLKLFAEQLSDNLNNNILPYWTERMTDPAGGFYGRRDGFDSLHPDAAKGAILNARILWTFSAAYIATQRPDCLEAATRAKNYILIGLSTASMAGCTGALTPTALLPIQRSSFMR